MNKGIHGRPRRATTAVTVAVFAVSCFVAFSPGAAASAVQVSSVANGEVGAPIVWGACDPPPPPGVDLQCARIRVPLDWDDPNGRTISLAVIRHLAQQAGPADRHDVHQPGRTRRHRRRPGAGRPCRTRRRSGGGRFDVVSWDPRGTNASTRVLCFRRPAGARRASGRAPSIPITRAASERFRRKTADLARRCGEVSGWLLPHISTADTARDLDHLRVLLGEEKLTYVGLSYGTYLGQTYANMFPDRVRAMLLDGIVDAVEYSKSAEARVGRISSAQPTRSSTSSSASVRERRARALRARRWRPDPRPSASSGCSRR